MKKICTVKIIGTTQLVMNNFVGFLRVSQHFCVGKKWIGIPTMAFKGAMIDAGRYEGIPTNAIRKAIHIIADGYEECSGLPLVKITKGNPSRFTTLFKVKEIVQ
jgi:hypothetical protein